MGKAARRRASTGLHRSWPRAALGSGGALIATGPTDEERAFRHCADAVRRGSTSPDVLNDFGAMLARRGQLLPAIAQLELALIYDGRHRAAAGNLRLALESLAVAAFGAGRWADATAAYRRLTEIEPASAMFWSNAGAALRELGRAAEALPYLRRACALEAASGTAHYNLGCVLLDLGQREAAAAFERTLELAPAHVDALVNLALVYDKMGALELAAATSRRALALDPANAAAHGNLASVLREQGDLAASLDHYRRAVELRPSSSSLFSDYLLARVGDPTATASERHLEHGAWSSRFAAPLDPGPWLATRATIDLQPGRRLRIGYVSPDLRAHAVASFLEPLLAAHDRSSFDVCVYSDATPDAVTERLRAHVDRWRDCRGLSDAALAEIIKADGIDILVDLAGHTAGNRLLCFARRPAPLQVSYCGYPASTGLDAIDFRLTDAGADPVDATGAVLDSQRCWRLPHGFLCYQQPAGMAVRAEEPSATRGYVTFGSFNNLAKVNDHVLDAWANILRAVPDARLLLKARALSDEVTRSRMRARFAQRGIDARRLELRSYAPTVGEHLAHYKDVDIALDTFPYNGTTTTCEALASGVPVLTVAGATHAARVGASLLTQAGCPELIADGIDAYVLAAVALAGDAKARAAWGDRLRTAARPSSTLLAPTLHAPTLLARDIEDAFREMWRVISDAHARRDGAVARSA